MRTPTPVSTPAGTTFERTLRVDRLQYWAGVQHAQNHATNPHPLAHPSYRLGVWHVREGIVPRVPLAKIHDGSGFIPEYDAPWPASKEAIQQRTTQPEVTA
jgi:hypothetical protein